MHTPLTDEEMIRQFRTDQSSHCFEALYNRYVKKVYRRCLSMTKDPLKAEDFTHDIFLKVFNKLDAFQQRSSFSTWLYTI
ncbi:RNA polymerase sigma factor [Spirosoma pollinicola]|uniref:RNA polymerase sigma factor n=1 Tax=Spirosoma pollinicola TaxID=2057025 RepID=UPI00269C5D00|nr:RNA polymerase sigma factor [Spirosoma pollinicola]